MEKFETIWLRAANRHDGEVALREKLDSHYYGTDLAKIRAPKTNDRWLSEFSKRIFQAGFNWQVVENKWEGFEEAFWNFDIARCARIDIDDMEKLTADTRIVRNPRKIKSVPINAKMIQQMTEEAGSADAFIRGWSSDNYIGLLDYLNKHGSNLGANTASYALRFSGVPSFILSKDVTAALINAGIIDKPPTSKFAKKAVQQAFNQWVKESGENLTFISRVLAHSVTVG